MNLNEIKENIVIVGPDIAMNKKVLTLVRRDIDCFGRAYLEEAVECKECIVFAELDGKRMELREFCKDFSGKEVMIEQKAFVEKNNLNEKGGVSMKTLPKTVNKKFLDEAKRLLVEDENTAVTKLSLLMKGNEKRAQKYVRWTRLDG